MVKLSYVAHVVLSYWIFVQSSLTIMVILYHDTALSLELCHYFIFTWPEYIYQLMFVTVYLF